MVSELVSLDIEVFSVANAALDAIIRTVLSPIVYSQPQYLNAEVNALREILSPFCKSFILEDKPCTASGEYTPMNQAVFRSVNATV